MPSTLPEGQLAPRDGSVPVDALERARSRPLSFYVHVPFCTVRCGYCDFNTYTARDLGPAVGAPGASRETYAAAAIAEVRLARRTLASLGQPVSTVFFGGGTPTLLPPRDLAAVLSAIASEFGLAPGAEVTTESNPDSVGPAELAALRSSGINRISFGMQSADPAVLGVLERTHDPARLPSVVAWAREAGFDQVSVDLIYGTPGESVESWRQTVESALALDPDHLSAYALIVEEGTALARRVRRGEIPLPDDDDVADKYELADALFSADGLRWYELSNWARDSTARCQHNLAYWTGASWWGIGPGAHSHVGGVRWWNVKHPAAYAERIGAGASPAHAREELDAESRRVERVLLESRLSDGLAVDVLDDAGLAAVLGLAADGLIDGEALARGRVVLTVRGRLLADGVVRRLLPG
ncbi:MAG TPA: radical SAM family heme chaperone HemW [Nocardioidaceae bacterium]|nr:radical SAM family heme chaperone HemW [Nocardioidaceae bacterium]